MDEANHIHSDMNVLGAIEERERQEDVKRQLRVIYNFAKRRNTVLGRTKAGKIFIKRYYEIRAARRLPMLPARLVVQ